MKNNTAVFNIDKKKSFYIMCAKLMFNAIILCSFVGKNLLCLN